jgi:hypothetical protein
MLTTTTRPTLASTDPLPGPDISDFDEGHEIRQAPPMPTPETPLREAIDELLAGALSPEDRAKLRAELRDELNLKIDIPGIGEKIEGVAIGFVLRIVEFVAMRLAKKYASPVIDKAEGLLK